MISLVPSPPRKARAAGCQRRSRKVYLLLARPRIAASRRDPRRAVPARACIAGCNHHRASVYGRRGLGRAGGRAEGKKCAPMKRKKIENLPSAVARRSAATSAKRAAERAILEELRLSTRAYLAVLVLCFGCGNVVCARVA